MSQPYPDEPTWWTWYQNEVASRYHLAGLPFPDNAAAFIWFSRCGYDIGAGMEKDAAARKHLKGLEQALGLNPNPEPIPGEHIDPLVGAVHLIDSGRGGVADNNGPRVLFGVHAGDLLSRWFNGDKDFVKRQLAYFASKGVHFIRVWTYLWGNWWATAPRPGEVHPGRQGYWDAVREFARLLRQYKIQWLVSQGDLFREPSNLDYKQNFMYELATILAEEGGLELVIGVDAGNENASAGDPSPETMARVLDPFLAILRPAFISTTSSDENDLNRYVSRVCTVCDSHAGRWPFKMAMDRLWTAGYWDGKVLPYLMSSEPMGVGCQEYTGDERVGHHISATARPSDWDDVEAMGVVAAAHYVSRQAYVYMSSPGVISDEDFSNYLALDFAGWLARRLPKNIQSWEVFHGGENRPFSPRRILAVPDDNAARAEHATNGTDYSVLYHGEAKTHTSRVINSFRGVRINLETKEESEVSWNAGDTVGINIRRGTLFLGRRV